MEQEKSIATQVLHDALCYKRFIAHGAEVGYVLGSMAALYQLSHAWDRKQVDYQEHNISKGIAIFSVLEYCLYTLPAALAVETLEYVLPGSDYCRE